MQSVITASALCCNILDGFIKFYLAVVGPKGVSIGIVHIQEGTYENIFVPYEGEIIRDKKSGIDWSNLEWPSDKNS